jgi:hypothetical protein
MAVTEPFQFDSGIVLQQIEAKQNSLRTEFTSITLNVESRKMKTKTNESQLNPFN